MPAFERARELTTWISEEGPEASLEQTQGVANFFGLKAEEGEAIVQAQRAVLSGWRTRAKGLGMAAADIEVYATAFDAAG